MLSVKVYEVYDSPEKSIPLKTPHSVLLVPSLNRDYIYPPMKSMFPQVAGKAMRLCGMMELPGSAMASVPALPSDPPRIICSVLLGLERRASLLLWK